jgi:hypothetical protein
MRRFSQLRERWRAVIRRLDLMAAWVNPILMIVAAYLLILDLSCFAALEIPRLPQVLSARLSQTEIVSGAAGAQ